MSVSRLDFSGVASQSLGFSAAPVLYFTSQASTYTEHSVHNKYLLATIYLFVKAGIRSCSPFSLVFIFEGAFAPIPVQFINHGSVTPNTPPRLGACQLHPNF